MVYFIVKTDQQLSVRIGLVMNRMQQGSFKIYNGDEYWHLNNELHRVDGPAIEMSNGTKCWYINDELHRIDGPAIEYPNGLVGYYYRGKQISEEYFLSDEFKVLVVMDE